MEKWLFLVLLYTKFSRLNAKNLKKWNLKQLLYLIKGLNAFYSLVILPYSYSLLVCVTEQPLYFDFLHCTHYALQLHVQNSDWFLANKNNFFFLSSLHFWLFFFIILRTRSWWESWNLRILCIWNRSSAYRLHLENQSIPFVNIWHVLFFVFFIVVFAGTFHDSFRPKQASIKFIKSPSWRILENILKFELYLAIWSLTRNTVTPLLFFQPLVG